VREEKEEEEEEEENLFVCSPCFLSSALPFSLRVCASRPLCSHRLLGLSSRPSLSSPSLPPIISSSGRDQLGEEKEEEEEDERLKDQTTDLKEKEKEGEKEDDARRPGTRLEEEKDYRKSEKAALRRSADLRTLDF
jgi:hypothetical protein